MDFVFNMYSLSTIETLQGEMVDRYLTRQKMFTAVISSSMHVGNIACSVIAAQLYAAGG